MRTGGSVGNRGGDKDGANIDVNFSQWKALGI